MGYIPNNIRRPWLCLDIETAPIVDIDQYQDDVRIDSRLRDPEKIAEARAVALGRAALDLDLLRIIAVGLWESSDDGPVVWTVTGGTPLEEALVVRQTWDTYSRVVRESGGVLVTSNGLGFDLPALIRRAQYLEVDYARGLDLNKYRPGAHIDLQNELSFSGAKPFRSLDFYARRFGVAPDIPDATSGADVAAMLAAGDWQGIRAHCLADVRRTQALAQRLGYIGAPVMEVV